MNPTLSAPLDVKLMNVTATALFWAVGAFGLAVALWWGLRHPLFAISTIRVEGDVIHTNAVTLRANVAHRLTGNFFTLDLAGARSAFESVPWVRRASVHREFPDHLVVQVQEHRPVAYWGPDDGSHLVNQQGEVFEANLGDLDSDDLPRLIGPPGQSAAVLSMYRALNPLFGIIDASIDLLELSDRGSWRTELDTGTNVELGRGAESEIIERVTRFVRTVGQSAARYERAPDAIESADLRHPSAYALKIRGVTTVTADAIKQQKPSGSGPKPADKTRDR